MGNSLNKQGDWNEGYFAWVFFVVAAVNTLVIYHSYVSGNAATLIEIFSNPGATPSFLNSIFNGLFAALCYWGWYKWD